MDIILSKSLSTITDRDLFKFLKIYGGRIKIINFFVGDRFLQRRHLQDCFISAPLAVGHARLCFEFEPVRPSMEIQG